MTLTDRFTQEEMVIHHSIRSLNSHFKLAGFFARPRKRRAHFTSFAPPLPPPRHAVALSTCTSLLTPKSSKVPEAATICCTLATMQRSETIAQTTLSTRSACRTLRRGRKTTSQHSIGKRTVAGQKPRAPARPEGEGGGGRGGVRPR